MRAGSFIDGKYVAVKDGGILHTLSYDSSATGATKYGPRVTPNLLGDGYVEAVSDEEIQKIAREQVPKTQGKIHGEIVHLTPGTSSGNANVLGRFGWKDQHASLLGASADALLNELGIPNRIFPGLAGTQGRERWKSHEPIRIADGELDAMVEFIRGTEPIAPDPARGVTEGALAGSKIFDRIGCSICHVGTPRFCARKSKPHSLRAVRPRVEYP